MPDPIEVPTPEPEVPATPDAPEPVIGGAPEPVEGETPVEGEPKPAEETKPAEAPAPVKIEDIKLPEGVTIAPEKFKPFQEFAAEHSLDTPAVQQLLDMHLTELKDAAGASVKQYLDLQKQWVDEVVKDPEIGGNNLPEVKGRIAKLIDDPRFSKTPEEAKALRAALALTGAGNNPVVVKFWNRVAKAFTESPTIQGRTPSAPKTAAQKMYPTLPSEQGI